MPGELGDRDADERPGHDVRRVVHAGVHARVGDDGRERLQRHRLARRIRPIDVANAKALAAWPDGNDVDRGIRTCRASGTCSGLGRLRPPIGLSTALTSMDVAATEARPAPAARRPDGPRLIARIAAADSQRRE